MRHYTRDELIRASLEASQRELEHDSDMAPVLASHGLDINDVIHVSSATANRMAETFGEQHSPTGELSPELTATIVAAATAGWIRGLVTALQLHRAE